MVGEESYPANFYEARFGVEIFAELYDSTLSSPVSSFVLKRYITFFHFIDVTIIVYCYYGCLFHNTFDFNSLHITLINLILNIHTTYYSVISVYSVLIIFNDSALSFYSLGTTFYYLHSMLYAV